MQALLAAVPPLSERVNVLRAALADPEAREAERALRKNIDARNAEAGALNLGPLIQRATVVGGPSGPEARLRDTGAAGRRARAEPCVRDAPAPLRLPTERAPLNREPSVAPLPSEGSPPDVPMPALIAWRMHQFDVASVWRLLSHKHDACTESHRGMPPQNDVSCKLGFVRRKYTVNRPC